jgi:hypothetical protein
MAETKTALQLITQALKVLGVIAQGETPTNEDLQDGLVTLNGMISSWATERLIISSTLRHVFALVPGQRDYTIGLGADFNIARPNWLPYAGLILNNQQPPIEIPLEIITVKDWWLVAIKDLTSTQPTTLYYDFAQPEEGSNAGYGTIAFWPVPQIAYDIALYLPAGLLQFADAATPYTLGDGYAIAIAYNLARLLARPNGVAPPADVVDDARRFKAAIKRVNGRLVDLSIDPALRPKPGVLYNWRSDTLR